MNSPIHQVRLGGHSGKYFYLAVILLNTVLNRGHSDTNLKTKSTNIGAPYPKPAFERCNYEGYRYKIEHSRSFKQPQGMYIALGTVRMHLEHICMRNRITRTTNSGISSSQ
jgi:hypothetical protein